VSSPKRRAVYEEFLKVPEWKVAEIIDGELIVSPRPSIPHAHTGSSISAEVWQSFNGPPGSPEKPGGWWILFEPELHLGDDVLVPDVAGWRRDHLPVLPAVAFMTQAPDWACEVISPSTGTIDRTRKMRIYAREGVAHLWLVEPSTWTLEVYRLEHGQWIVASTHGDDDVVRAEPFDAVALALGRWWLPEAQRSVPAP
jgi:Uma2 family endonuclease